MSRMKISFARFTALLAAFQAASLITIACAFACEWSTPQLSAGNHCHQKKQEVAACPILESLSQNDGLRLQSAPALPPPAVVARIVMVSLPVRSIAPNIPSPPLSPDLFRNPVLRL